MALLLFYSPANILNVSEIPLNVDDAWAAVLSSADDIYKDKPIIKKKSSKKEVSSSLI